MVQDVNLAVSNPPRRIVVGISGASGVTYGVRVLDALRDLGVESHLVVTKAVDLAIEKARHTGVAWVSTRMSNHAGPASLEGLPFGKGEIRKQGSTVAILAFGTLLQPALVAAEALGSLTWRRPGKSPATAALVEGICSSVLPRVIVPEIIPPPKAGPFSASVPLAVVA